MAEKKSKPQNQTSFPEDGEHHTTEKDKKRFCLRDELSEVKLLLESSSDGDPEERFTAVHRRYHLLARDYKRLEKRLVECQRKQIEVAQHRDIIQNEYSRTNLAKTKLESLCRELQRHSKAVAEESKQRQKEEEDRRKEVSAKFQTTINEITLKMQEHHQRNQTLRQENLEMATKMKELVEQYKAREEHYDKLVQHKQLEVQLCEAKLEQHKVMVAEEKHSSLEERQMLLEETLKQQTRCEQLTHQEADLRGQLSLYSEKFDEFQSTLTKSNEVFNTFKKEMDKMAKTIAALEKEMLIWKKRYEKSNKALLEMTNERGLQEQSLQTIRSKNDKLEKLCRALQAERTELKTKKEEFEDRCRALQTSRAGEEEEEEEGEEVVVENAVEKEVGLVGPDHAPNPAEENAAD